MSKSDRWTVVRSADALPGHSTAHLWRDGVRVAGFTAGQEHLAEAVADILNHHDALTANIATGTTRPRPGYRLS
jgi:hypothetical protein